METEIKRDLILIKNIPYEGVDYKSYDIVSNINSGSCCLHLYKESNDVDIELYGYGQYAISKHPSIFNQVYKGMHSIEFIKKRILRCKELNDTAKNLLESSVIFFNIYTLRPIFIDKATLIETYGNFHEIEVIGMITKQLIQVRFDERIVTMYNTCIKYGYPYEVVPLIPKLDWPETNEYTTLTLTLCNKEVL